MYLYSTFLQAQQETSSSLFHCLKLELYIHTFPCCKFLLFVFICLFGCLRGYHVIIASGSSIFVFIYFFLFMFLRIGILNYNFTII